MQDVTKDEKQLALLRARISALEQANKDLRAQQAKSTKAHSAEIEKQRRAGEQAVKEALAKAEENFAGRDHVVGDQLAALHLSYDSLKKKEQAVESALQQEKARVQQLEALCAEIGDKAKASIQEASDFKTTIKTCREDLQNVGTKLQQKDAALRDLQNQVESMRSEVAQTKALRDKIKTQESRAAATASQHQVELSSLKKELGETKKRLRDLQKVEMEHSKLKGEYGKAQKNNSDLEKQVREAEKKARELSKIQDNLAAFKKRLAGKETDHKSVKTQLSEQSKKHAAAMRELSGKHDQARKELEQGRRDWLKRAEEHQKTLDRHRENAKKEKSVWDSERDALKRQIKDEQVALDEHVQRITQMETASRNAKRDAETNKKAQKIMGAQNLAMQQSLKEALTRVREMQTQMASLKKNVGASKETQAQMKEQLNNAERVADQKRALEDELATSKSNVQEMEQTMQHLQADLSALRNSAMDTRRMASQLAQNAGEAKEAQALSEHFFHELNRWVWSDECSHSFYLSCAYTHTHTHTHRYKGQLYHLLMKHATDAIQPQSGVPVDRVPLGDVKASGAGGHILALPSLSGKDARFTAPSRQSNQAFKMFANVPARELSALMATLQDTLIRRQCALEIPLLYSDAQNSIQGKIKASIEEHAKDQKFLSLLPAECGVHPIDLLPVLREESMATFPSSAAQEVVLCCTSKEDLQNLAAQLNKRTPDSFFKMNGTQMRVWIVATHTSNDVYPVDASALTKQNKGLQVEILSPESLSAFDGSLPPKFMNRMAEELVKSYVASFSTHPEKIMSMSVADIRRLKDASY